MICANCTEDVPDGNFCPSCGQPPLLEGRYQLDSIVGHGAHGTTYRATRITDGEVVAIKELLVRKVESVKALELFGREVRVLRELDHPGVPQFIEELHVDAGRSVALYLVQEFILGRTIAEEFAQQRGTEAEVFELAAELLDTLAYLHELRPPVIHRDIKPGNVMRRTATGQLVLIDFGSVRDAIDTAEGGSTVAGTFGYMAPEQFMGRALPATDIYGVGATVVALLSRQDPQELLGSDRTIEWQGKLGLSPVFAQILAEMLTEGPDQRASDAGILAEKIRAGLRGEIDVPVAPRSPVRTSPSAGPALRPVPPAPRELPNKFRKQYVAGASFNLMFGAIFSVAGVFSGVIPIIVAIGTGELFPIAMSLLFFAIFGGIGGFTFRAGLTRLQKARRAYTHGDAVEGYVTRIGTSSYRVNNQAATIYHYEYVVNGQAHDGEFHSWDPLDLQAGARVSVLVDPSDASNSVMFAPDQFSTVHRIRAQMAAQQKAPSEVQFDFAEAQKQVEQEEPAESQVW